MSGHYTLYDVDLFNAVEENISLQLDSGSEGIACIVRDGRDVIDFRLLKPSEIPAAGLSRNDLYTAQARKISAYARHRKHLTIEPANVPDISVAICTKDRPDWLRRLLNSLSAQKTDQTFEIVVIDNNSDSPDIKQIAEEAGAIYYRETRAGLNFARNAALSKATGDVIAFLDDDTTAEPEWFGNLSRVWAENPDAGCITGLVLPMSLDNEAQVAFERDGGFRRALVPERYAKRVWDRPLHPCGAGEFGAGANMSLNKKIVLDLGGFDVALDTGRPLPGGGDLDIFYRVIRADSILIYDPCIVIRHDHRRDLKILKHQYYTWGLGLFAFLDKSKRSDPENRKNLSEMGRWVWLGLIKRLFQSLVGRDTRPTRMILAELRGVLKGQFGEYERSLERVNKIQASHND